MSEKEIKLIEYVGLDPNKTKLDIQEVIEVPLEEFATEYFDRDDYPKSYLFIFTYEGQKIERKWTKEEVKDILS